MNVAPDARNASRERRVPDRELLEDDDDEHPSPDLSRSERVDDVVDRAAHTERRWTPSGSLSRPASRSARVVLLPT